jgi:hypothetical protein
MQTDTEKIASLEREMKQLSTKLETLVNYLNAQGSFGPPRGRESYDSMVKQALAKANLQE